MRGVCVLTALAAALAGCATDPQAQMASDDAQCRSYGVQRGSPGYVQCRMSLDQGRAIGEASARQGSYATMMGVGYGMMGGR